MRALALLALLLLPGCGAAEERDAATGGERVAGHGLEITIPQGWHGDVTKLGPHHAATLRAATFPLGREPEVGHDAQRTMGDGELLIAVADYGAGPGGGEPPPSGLPIHVGKEHVGNFEGFHAPVATTTVVVAGGTLQVWVVAAAEPTSAQLERANAVLATLRVDRSRWREHVDDERGLAARIPAGWAVADESLTPSLRDPTEILSVGTGPFRPGGERCTHVPERTLESLGPEDALVTVVEFATRRGLPPRPDDLLAAEGSEPESRDCLSGARDLEYRLVPFTDARRDFYVYVAFGERATDERRREAARLLASLRFEPPAQVAFADPDVGVSGRHPAGWHRARALTAFDEPREVLALASYPLRAGAEAGECAPDTARADMPAGGAFIWLLEYREVLPASRFPERPAAFHLERSELDDHVSCFPGPGYSTTFRASGRQFQLLVAFGGPPTGGRLREVEAVLDGLAIEPQPAASPPPLGRWRLAVTATGDSLRTPPGWPSAAGNPYGREGPYGPPLFFAANRPLVGLPSEPGSEADLPGPLPDNALANGFPPDGVLLWVLDDSGRQPLARGFAPIERDWPRRDDFEPVEIVTKPAPELRWLVAAGNVGGRRVSVWIARGPQASGADLSLALESASTLALAARR